MHALAQPTGRRRGQRAAPPRVCLARPPPQVARRGPLRGASPVLHTTATATGTGSPDRLISYGSPHESIHDPIVWSRRSRYDPQLAGLSTVATLRVSSTTTTGSPRENI